MTGYEMKFPATLGIALLLATAAEAAPDRNETVSYIQKQCEGTATGSGSVTSNVRIEGTVLSFTDGVPVDASAKGDVAFWQEVRTIDLQEVSTISELPSFTQLQCNHNCARVDGFYLGVDGKKRQPSWGNKSGTTHLTYINLYCRNADRVANAIKHLQSLTPDNDPFAN
jgi:hypothetical protein